MSSVLTIHDLKPPALPVPRNARTAHYCSLGFALFVLVNATLFIRPSEIIASLEELPIYLILILATLLLSLPVVLPLLSWQALSSQPAIACVLALWPAVLLSHLTHRQTWHARIEGTEFAKVIVYYALLVGLVNSTQRLRRFLQAIVLFIFITAVLSLLQYYDVIQLQNVSALERTAADVYTGDMNVVLVQLRGAGIFSDPNDLSLILVTGMLVLLHHGIESGNWLRRCLLALPIAVFGFAFALTNSRGGFVSLIAGVVAMMMARRGVRRSLPIMLLVIPLLVIIFAGRQTTLNLTDSQDTFQGRLYLWRDGMAMFKEHPFFGIGKGLFEDNVQHTAHNSFVLCYSELGMFGGTLFLGAFLLPLEVLRKRPARPEIAASELGRWRPCLIAVFIAYAVGACSLSRSYIVSSYTLLGLAAVYCRLLAEQDPKAVPALSVPMARRLVAASVGAVITIHFFIKVVLR